MLHACCLLHKLDFALIYTLLQKESATRKRFRSQLHVFCCCQSTCPSSFLFFLCLPCCLLLPSLPASFCLPFLLYTGIYIAEMTSVSNVKGQKRVCKFKYESQQHLSFYSLTPFVLSLSLSLPLLPLLLSLAHSQHATWGQVEYAAQTLLQFEAVARPAATCAAWQGETDWPQLPLSLLHTPLSPPYCLSHCQLDLASMLLPFLKFI